MHNRLFSFLFFWILGWLFVGTQQIIITIDLFNAEPTNDSWPPAGYVIAEKGSNKVMVKEETVTKNTPKILILLTVVKIFLIQ